MQPRISEEVTANAKERYKIKLEIFKSIKMFATLLVPSISFLLRQWKANGNETETWLWARSFFRLRVVLLTEVRLLFSRRSSLLSQMSIETKNRAYAAAVL